MPNIKVRWDSRSGISSLSFINMAGDSIKLFQFIQRYCQTIGVYPPRPNQNRYYMNSMNWFAFFCLDQFLISTAGFILFEANSMAEYTTTFFICLITVGCNIFSLLAFRQAKNISNSIGNWEVFIEKSESYTALIIISFQYIQNIFCHTFFFLYFVNIFYAIQECSRQPHIKTQMR